MTDGQPSGYGDRSPFAPAERSDRLHRWVPLTQVLRHYGAADARADLVAGLTVGALALPSGMAFAELAGLPPVAGLYALLLPTVLYTIVGTSRQLIVGPEAVAATITAATLAPLAAGDPARYGALAAGLALVVGALFVLASVLRLGFVADYFSRAVLVGYLTGVGFTLITGQIEKLTGISVDGLTARERLWSFVQHLDDFDTRVALVGGVSVAALLLLRRFAPRVPGALVVVVVAVVVSAAADLSAHGIPVIGSIPAGLPTLGLPDLDGGDLLELLPGALGVFFVVFGDATLIARSFAGRHGRHVRVGQELLGLGLANAAAGVSGAFPVGGSGSRTAVNDAAGNRTQLSGLVGAVFIAVVLLFLTGPMAELPTAVLGAVIVVAAIGLLDPGAWRALDQVARREVVIAVVAAIGVITVGVLPALIVAVVLSILDAVLRSARPHDAVLGWVPRLERWADVSVHPSAEVTDGVVVYRLDGRLFFANAAYVRARVAEAVAGAPTPAQHLVFDLESVTSIDATGLEALGELLDDLGRRGVDVRLARCRAAITDLLATAGVVDRIGVDHLHPTVRGAVEAAAAP